jgi:uncharacterized membrane protein YphA (DoxX/SURF4 family)
MLKEFGRSALGPLMLRAALALICIENGLQKINEQTKWGTEWSVQNPDTTMLVIQATVAWGEVVGGGLLAVGLLTRVTAFLLLCIQGGAMYVIAQTTPFFQFAEKFTRVTGPEYNLALMAMCAALLCMGAGSIALDRFFRRKPAPAAA